MSLLANSNAIETGGYQISRSVRLRSSASAYLNRTAGSAATDGTKWTISCWAKRGILDSGASLLYTLMSAEPAATTYLSFYQDKIYFQINDGGAGRVLQTTQVFRDPSAWYHCVFVWDRGAATASQKMRLYINGTEVTSFSTDNRSLISGSASPGILTQSVSNTIGRRAGASGDYYDGYITEFNAIDGQALTPSSFGETDPITGSWVAKKYTGTYGTNGFYLNFSDNSAATSTTIGKDSSGNGNNWTPNNISVTAGTTYDSMLDVPSGNGYADGGNGRGNYATLNPVASVTTPPTFTNGNLEVTGPSSGVGATVSTFGGTSGKFYVEVTVTRASDRLDLGIAGSLTASTFMTSTNYLGTDTNTIGYGTSTGVIRKDNANNQTGLATCTTGDVVGMAIDMDSGTIQFYKNNSTVGTAVSFTPSAYGSFLIAQTTSFNTSKGTYNFGQRPFTYTPPTGFKALNTTNLPDPTVKKGSSYFDVVAYSGNGSSPRNVVTNLAFQPDFAWLKCRNAAYNHTLFDSVRGAGSTKGLSSNVTDAEGLGGSASATSQYGYVSAFNSDGIQVTTGSIDDLYVNDSSATYVAWNWKANGAGVSNTDGSITSTVSANPTAGFSIVSYAGNSASNQTIGHGLTSAPKMVVHKNRTNANDWVVDVGNITGTAGNALRWNNTSSITNNVAILPNKPTSSVFYVSTDSGEFNVTGRNYIAYCFADVEGYSKFGSYTGNGSADGPFVFLGFRPKYVLIKQSSTSGTDWIVYDSTRNPYNLTNLLLSPNSSAAEATSAGSNTLDLLSNGFKLRSASTGSNGGTMIYAAFAESPFKFSNAR